MAVLIPRSVWIERNDTISFDGSGSYDAAPGAVARADKSVVELGQSIMFDASESTSIYSGARSDTAGLFAETLPYHQARR